MQCSHIVTVNGAITVAVAPKLLEVGLDRLLCATLVSSAFLEVSRALATAGLARLHPIRVAQLVLATVVALAALCNIDAKQAGDVSYAIQASRLL